MQLSEQQVLIQRTADSIATQELVPRASKVDKEQMFPTESLNRLAQSGFMGLTVPEELGGGGADSLSFVLVMESLGRGCGSTALVYLTHAIVAKLVASAGNEEQKGRLLPPMVAGKKLGALAATESSSGSNALAIKSRAIGNGSSFVVNGSKTFITSAEEADIYVVILGTDLAKGPADLSALVLERGMPGFTFGKKEEFMGLRGAANGELVFTDCKVPRTNLLGPENGYVGISAAYAGLAMLGMAGLSLGIAQAAVDAATQYAKARQIGGQAISQFQGIQYLISEMTISLAAARAFAYSAAAQLDQKQASPLPAYMAKLHATEAAIDIANKALQVHGGTGYSRDLPVERYYRDARGLNVHFTPTEVLKGMLGKMLMGMPPM
jgi:alkylation response protein AidB-like acyl-CoA dehydrogenase